MALQNSTEQGGGNGTVVRQPGLGSAILDPTVIRWAHPMVAVSLVFAHVGSGGHIAPPVLGGVAALVLLVTALQLRLHTSEPKTYASPHLVQPLVTLLLIVALALSSDPLSLVTMIGVVVFEVWLELLADLKPYVPSSLLQPLRWFLPFFSTFALLASFRALEPLGVVLVAFLLPLWLTVLPEPQTWET